MSMIWEMHKWGLTSIPQPESAAIPTIGSLARIYPQTQAMSLPRGLQISVSTDGSQWSQWTDVDFSKAVTVPFPGFLKFRAYNKTAVRVFNYKSPQEADSVVGLTVVLGQYGVV
ncbi:MAG: hypothetical protein PHG75_05915 [Syntrophomonas sp.]|nr:hypothetical protein [Syntrophomonas sp.]